MKDKITCEMAEQNAPPQDKLDAWELEESWVVVTAESMRAIAFTRQNVRPGEKAAQALVIFSATSVREATKDERLALMQARKEVKTAQKARRAERQAAKAQIKTSAA